MSLSGLFVAGLNHRTAPVPVREGFSIPQNCAADAARYLQCFAGLTEAVVLSTCNRTEIYGVKSPGAPGASGLFNMLFPGRMAEAPAEFLYVRNGAECVRHLFRVASSLDSLVLGETEISGQVKRAYQNAHHAGATGKTLNRLFQKALSVSKGVRTRSGIGRFPTSVGAVSVDLAHHLLGENLRDKTILIIGAGKLGETTLRHLSKHGAGSILVCNRSPERASELASRFNGKAVAFARLPEALAAADIVISSTGAPHHVVGRKDLGGLMASRRQRPLFLVDLAVPRDIDPRVQDLESVYLYNIDQLSDLAQQNRAVRQTEAAACETLVSKAVLEFARQLEGGTAPRERRGIESLFPALETAPLQFAAFATAAG